MSTTTLSFIRQFAFFGMRLNYNGISYWLPIFVEKEQVNENSSLIVVYSIEMALILIALLLNAYFVYYVVKISPLHVNLRMILGAYTFYSMFGVSSRAWLFILQLDVLETDELMMITFICSCIRVEFFAFSTFFLPIIVLERAFATYFVMSYETKKRRWVALLSLLIGFGFTFSFSIPSLFTMTTSKYYVVLVIVVVSSSSLTFYIITKYNSEKLQKLKDFHCMSNNEKYTLSARFQCDENLRVFQVLKYLFLVNCSLIACILFCYIMAKYVYEKGDYLSLLFISFFDFFIALAMIVIPLTCIAHAGHLPFTVGQKHVSVSVKDTDAETDSYFSQLQNAWA